MTAKRLVFGVLAIAAVMPASALGSKAKPTTVAPTTAQRAAIIRGFGDPGAASPCLIVRLAASNRNYATVRFRSTRRCQRWAFNGKNIIKRGRQGRWSVAFEGSAYGCPLARIPVQVQRDLGACPEATQSRTVAWAAAPVKITNCVRASSRPRALTLTCGDGNTVLTELRWSSFGGASARARGTLEMNTCSPNCARGNVVSYPVAVRANAPRTCKAGLRVYNKLTLQFIGRAPTSVSDLKRWTLGCPT